MDDIRVVFGARIRELRLARKLTQERLAEKAEVHPVYLSGIERGLRSPRINVAHRIALALGVPTKTLFEEKGTPIPAGRQPR